MGGRLNCGGGLCRQTLLDIDIAIVRAQQRKGLLTDLDFFALCTHRMLVWVGKID